MYAVIRTGGKQVRVSPGQSVRVEKLAGGVGDTVNLGDVLMVGGGDAAPRVGATVVSGATDVGIITAQGRGPKITIVKMKRRKGYRRRQGHRQSYTELRIDRIEG